MEIIKDERVKKIIEKIKNAIKLTAFNGNVYLTGGVIRDSILNIPIKDVDVVVTIPDGGIVLANLLAAREKCYLLNRNPVVFPSYGTAKLCFFKDEELKDIDIEFVETRKCAYDFNKDCNGTLEEDSKRRDLSINALYWNINDGKLYDYNCGVDDLVSQTLRCPNPEAMYVEDPIKMLRTIRFSSQLGWGIEKNTWLAMIHNSKRIKDVATEKITIELSKILTSPNASMGIRKMMYCGLLHRILPDIYDLTTVYESRNPMVTAFDHTMKVLDTVQPLIESRLAALYHDVGSVITESKERTQSRDMFSAEVAMDEIKNLRFSNNIAEAVGKAIRYHRVFNIYADGITPPDKKIRKFLSLVGEHIGTTMDLMNANNLHCTYGKKKRQALDILNRIEELDKEEETKNVKLPINGIDVIKCLGLKRGTPVVGVLLEKVKDTFFENPNITKEECLEIIKKEAKALAV